MRTTDSYNFMGHDMHESGLTCTHMPEGEAGLCETCSLEWEEDANGYLEFGNHPAGNRRRVELKREIDAWYEATAKDRGASIKDDEIPF